MRRIYHLVAPAAWNSSPGEPYRADSLEREGFIHCSYGHQVAGAANRFYATAPELLVLALDPTRLTSPLREEAASNGELFPHIYGPINRDAVVEVLTLARDTGEKWIFPGSVYWSG